MIRSSVSAIMYLDCDTVKLSLGDALVAFDA
jgi:hypothetical protein